MSISIYKGIDEHADIFSDDLKSCLGGNPFSDNFLFCIARVVYDPRYDELYHEKSLKVDDILINLVRSNLEYENLKYPFLTFKDYENFERDNPSISLKIYTIGEDEKSTWCSYSKTRNREHNVFLLLWKNHYYIILDMIHLTYDQISSDIGISKSEVFFCKNCGYYFCSKKNSENHINFCK